MAFRNAADGVGRRDSEENGVVAVIDNEDIFSNGDPDSAITERTALLSKPTKDPPKPRVGLDPAKTSPLKTKLLVISMMLSAFLSCLDMTIVATCIPTISSDLKASDQGSWIGTAYLASTVTFTPLYGRLSDIVGRRNAFVQALFLFGIGTLACGLANDLVTLAIARFVAGTGGGGTGVVASVIVGDLFSIRDRGFYQGLFFLGVGAGLGLGGPIGGIMTQALGWRAAFYVQLPLVAICILLAATCAHGEPHLKVDLRTIIRRIDFGGSASLLLSMGSLLLCLSQITNSQLPLSHPGVIASFAVFVTFLLVFIYVEIWYASEPVLPLVLLKKRTPLCVGIISGVIAIVNFSMVYTLPMFFEIVLRTSVSEAGAHLIPNSVAMGFGSVIVGYLIKRTGYFKWLTTVCCVGPVVAMLLLSTLNEESSTAALWLDILPMGAGFSGLLTSTLIAMMSAVDQSQVAVATGFVFVWRSLGQVLGVSVGSAVFQGSLSVELAKRFDDPAIIARLRHASESVNELPEAWQRIAAREAFKVSIHHVFYFSAGAAVLVLLASLPIPNRKLPRGDDDAAAGMSGIIGVE